MDTTAILLIEDNAGDALLVSEYLREPSSPPFDESYEVHHLERLAQVQEWTASNPPPGVVLLDLGLPDSHGTQALRFVRRTLPSVPVIVLTGLADSMITGEALKLGAQDYLIKGSLTGSSLRRAIYHAREREEHLATIRRSNEELRRFAYTVAHDLKSPMASIIGLLEVLRDHPTEISQETVETFLDRGVKAGGRLADMIDGLLAHAASIGGPSAPSLMDLSDVAEWVTEVLADRIEAANAEIRVGRLPSVIGHEAVLRQVFLNLMSNSLKYRGDQPPLITIDAAPEGEDSWHITVEDNGRGVPADRREAVFDLGRRLSSTAAGAGVGLAAVKHAVDAMGGRVWIDDPPSGSGTRVNLVLPA